MFQKLTGFIERLDSEEYGNWVIDKENDGSVPNERTSTAAHTGTSPS